MVAQLQSKVGIRSQSAAVRKAVALRNATHEKH